MCRPTTRLKAARSTATRSSKGDNFDSLRLLRATPAG
jgi:hypothetical protein